MIPLTAADPDYPVALEIQEAMMDYVKDGYFSYTPKLGYPEFRDSITKALMERKGEEIDPKSDSSKLTVQREECMLSLRLFYVRAMK